MKSSRFRVCLIIATISVLLLAVGAELLYFSDFEYRFRTRMFNKKLAEKEKILEECLNSMRPILAKENHHGSISETDLFSTAEENDITILEYIDNKLVYWSDNGFDVPVILENSIYAKPLVFLQNGWFLTKTITAGNEIIVGLLRVYTDYGFENDIIRNGYEKGYLIPENTGLVLDKDDSEYQAYNKEGDFLFSIVYPQKRVITYFILVPVLLWTLLFLLIIILTTELTKLLLEKGRPYISLGLLFLIYSIIYLLILFFRKPQVFFQTELFSNYIFSLNSFIPSLGHLIVISILSYSLSFFFFNHINLPEKPGINGIRSYFLLTLLFSFGALLFCFCSMVLGDLISDSNINFESYKVLELNLFSFAGFASVTLMMTVPVLFVMKTFQLTRHISKHIVFLSIFSSLAVPFIILLNEPGSLLSFIIFYITIVISLWITGIKKIGVFNEAVILSLIFGLFSLYKISILSETKTIDNLKIQAVSFSTDNDPEAEHLILDFWPVMQKDSILAGMMRVEFFNKDDYDKILFYLKEKYFTGYWRNFNLSIVLCNNDESITLGEDYNLSENCFSFFDNRIRRDGNLLTGTGFYFMDNQGGRTYYLGRMMFKTGLHTSNGLFIELFSDVNVFQPGYSELLLDKRYHGYSGLKDYSFAKYINGEIVLRTGEFPYDKTDISYVGDNSEYRLFMQEGYKHLLYKNGNSTVVISRPELKAKDTIISFAYIFVFLLLFINLLLLIYRRPDLKKVFFFNFRQKLQLSFIGILLFSFLMIGSIVVSFTISQYQVKQTEILKEKLNSIYLELEGKISEEKYLSSDWRNSSYESLNELLIKFSNVFKTDINLYDLNGFLIATSRPEIYIRDLQSRRINNLAFISLTDLTKSEYFQKEKTGTLEYVSAYVPFFNSDNKVIAYLNLPHFRMQSVLAKEVSNMIVAAVNFTLLLIVITMTLAVFISGRLTSPLMMLSEGLASVGIGRKSEHLKYTGSDEIAELVKQYNMMVDEIELSAHRLANSEREYAWREMAKQVAHEIKNPLTPMKLNVQQLYKSWNDKVPEFDKEIGRFTKNQIEYIDNLSSIASAFSSFAKMPGTNLIEVNLVEQIKITLELFKDTDNITFRVNWPAENKVVVYADKEHLNGIFSNILKNGIQSIPAGRAGVIDVNMEVKGPNVVVSISDNGVGIPAEMYNRMFTPNFTTKSSGTGLGLSIVKKFVESSNGRIWFDSREGNGTIFYVELPLKYTVEQMK